MPPLASKKPLMPSRRERLAISLVDVLRIPAVMRVGLLADRLSIIKEDVFAYGKGEQQDVVVAFKCDLLVAATICDTIRHHDQQVGDAPTRLYLTQTTVWDRLPNTAVLTVPKGDRYALNPEYFPAPAVKLNLTGFGKPPTL